MLDSFILTSSISTFFYRCYFFDQMEAGKLLKSCWEAKAPKSLVFNRTMELAAYSNLPLAFRPMVVEQPLDHQPPVDLQPMEASWSGFGMFVDFAFLSVGTWSGFGMFLDFVFLSVGSVFAGVLF